MSTIPAELRYTTSHEWVSVEDDVYTIGLTDFAQDALGDLVFVNLPQEGDEVVAGEAFADVESVKAVSDVFSPVIHQRGPLRRMVRARGRRQRGRRAP